MEWLTVTSMLAAITIIVILLVGGGARFYIRRRFNVQEHFDAIAEAAKRQQVAKKELHNVQTR